MQHGSVVPDYDVAHAVLDAILVSGLGRMRCKFPCRPICELYVLAPPKGLTGNARANVCRIDRAEERLALALVAPISDAIHG